MSSPCPVEEGLNRAYENAARCVEDGYSALAGSVRSAPVTSVLIASLAGYVVSFLPLGALGGLVLRVVLVLLRPAFFIFGILKFAEFLRIKAGEKSLADGDLEPDPVTDSPPGP